MYKYRSAHSTCVTPTCGFSRCIFCIEFSVFPRCTLQGAIMVVRGDMIVTGGTFESEHTESLGEGTFDGMRQPFGGCVSRECQVVKTVQCREQACCVPGRRIWIPSLWWRCNLPSAGFLRDAQGQCAHPELHCKEVRRHVRYVY